MKFSVSVIPFLFLCSSTLVASLPAPPSLPIGSKSTTTQSSSPLSLLSSPLGGTNDASSSPPSTFSPSLQASSPESEPEPGLDDAGHGSPLSLLELIDSPSSSSANPSPSTSDSASPLSSLPGALDQPSSQASSTPGASPGPGGLNLPSTSNLPGSPASGGGGAGAGADADNVNPSSSSSPLSGLSLLGRKVVVLGRRASASLTGDQGKEEAELGEERRFYKRAERFLIRMERASLLARGVKML